MAMLALFLSNKLLSWDCSLNVAEKCLGLDANIGGSYGGKFKFEDNEEEEDDDDNNDKIDEDDKDGMNKLSLS
jgi:hypothetical protein